MGWGEVCPFLQDWILASEFFYVRLASSKHRDLSRIYPSVA